MGGARSESIRVGGACALVGLAGVGAVSVVRPDSSAGSLFVAAALSAFLSGTFCRAFFVAPHPTASRLRVALVMAGAATLGHFLTWALFSATISPRNYVQNPSELLKVPILALLSGLGSLLVIGWLTIPLGIGIGLLFRSRRDKAPSPPGRPRLMPYAFRQQPVVTEARMKTRSLLAPFLGAVALLAAGCSDTPTESSPAPATGSLVISLTQPCPLTGSVSVVAGGTQLGALVVPGQNTFSVPAGSYSLSFVRGQQAFAASGQVHVPAGGSVVLTDPPAACMSSTGAP